jgi:uncharacterized protein
MGNTSQTKSAVIAESALVLHDSMVGNRARKMQGNRANWTIERIILMLLSLLVGLVVASSLISSWSEPQVQGRLGRAQSELLLQAAGSRSDLPLLLYDSLVGKEALSTATTQYEESRKTARDTVDDLRQQLKESRLHPTSQIQSLDNKLQAAQTDLQKINLELGLLQAVQKQPAAAQQRWQQIGRDLPESAIATTADTLDRLWGSGTVVPEVAEQVLQKNLQGWFRAQGLKKLYGGNPDKLKNLAQEEVVSSREALYRLAAITILRGGSVLLGLVVAVGLLVRQVWQRPRPVPTSGALVKIEPRSGLLRRVMGISAGVAERAALVVPWDFTTIWKVLLAFFLIGQLILPQFLAILLSVSGLSLATAPLWQKALFVLISYGLLALGVTVALILFISPFQPLSADWFNWKGHKNWFFWGLGGYLVANPIVLPVLALNDKLWNGQGGSNPILSVVLESKDSLSFLLLSLTAAVAAPLFEEYLFRGFLLTSLTRYLASWQAIMVSALIFATAHLSVSEILPLTALGMVLGYVYQRSGSLLAPMLLHGLWNGSSMLTLYLLAS